ncbi:MAG: nucleotidyltransferase domain-containing protein [Phycisphaerae bacterium]
MEAEDLIVLRRLADRVRHRFPDANVWAYGSRARGDAAPDSDFDVCIVVDTLDEQVDQQIMDIAWEVGFDEDVVISTVTFSRREFTSGPMSHSPLVRTIRRDGVAA